MPVPMIFQDSPYKNGEEAGKARDRRRQEEYERMEAEQSKRQSRNKKGPVLDSSIGSNSRGGISDAGRSLEVWTS